MDFYDKFFQYQSKGKLKKFLPEIEALKNVSEIKEHHPEGNTFNHIILCLRYFLKKDRFNFYYNYEDSVMFGIIFHDVGKLLTPKEILPHHYGHEKRGMEIVEKVCNRLNIAQFYKKIAILSIRYHLNLRRICDMRVGHIFDMLKDITEDFSNIHILETLFEISESDLFGREKKPSDEQIEKLEKSKDIAYRMYNIIHKKQLGMQAYKLTKEELINYYCNKIKE